MTLKKTFMDTKKENSRPASAMANNKKDKVLDINSFVDTISFLERNDMALDDRTILPQNKRKRLFSATAGARKLNNRTTQGLVESTVKATNKMRRTDLTNILGSLRSQSDLVSLANKSFLSRKEATM